MRLEKRKQRLLASAIFAGALAFAATPAFAVDGDDPVTNPLGLFELDGNPQQDLTAPPDDWETLFLDCGTPGDSPCGDSETFTGIISDPADPDDLSIFTGGGSKDIHDISQAGVTTNEWLHDVGSTPDKDDITNAYAAAYINPEDVCFSASTGLLAVCGVGDALPPLHEAGDLIIYFGADRFANKGDAFLGFWFFQNQIGLTNDPRKGGFEFSGTHEVGDPLVLVEFPQGSGAQPEIKVFAWDPDDIIGDPNVANNLTLLITETDALCDGAGGKLACAITNDEIDGFGEDIGDVPSPWPYIPKDGTDDVFPFETFYSGGINLTQVLGETLCISSFLAETRSSRSETAQLKDFALGAFEVCGLSVDKTGDTLSKIGDPVSWTITVENTGFASIFAQEIDDNVLGDLIGTGNCSGEDTDKVTSCVIDSNDCGGQGIELLPGDTCTIEVSGIVAGDAPDPLVNTVDVIFTADTEGFGAEFTGSDSHSVNLFTAGVTVTKGGDTLSKEGDQITYDYEITNDSSSDAPNLIMDSINDTGDNFNGSGLGDLTGNAPAACDDLAFGESCTFSVNYTIQVGDDDPLDNTVEVHYHPLGFTNDISDTDTHQVNLFQPSVTVDKTGDTLSKVTDGITYDYVIENTSSSDTPPLLLNSIDDTGDNFNGAGLGDLTGDAPAACDELVSGAKCSFSVNYTIQTGDDNPLDNEVEVHYHPTGFLNDISNTDTHSVDLFAPSYTLTKVCAPLTGAVPGDVLTYTYKLTNTSSGTTPPSLVLKPNSAIDALFGDVSALGTPTWPGNLDSCFGAGCEIVITHTAVPADVGNSPIGGIINTVYSPNGFPNELPENDSATCEVIKLDSITKTEIHDASQDLPHGDIQHLSNPQDVGITIHDFVIVQEASELGGFPEPTGNVTFELYLNTLCTDPALDVAFAGVIWPQVIALGDAEGVDNEKGTAVTPDITPPGNTNLAFKAFYPGNDIYNESEGACEPLIVNKFDPKIDTHIIIRDKALVSGDGPNPPTDLIVATGFAPTVTFEYFVSNDCTGAILSLGSDQDLPGTAMVESAAEVTVSTLGATTINSFRATYNGNDDYNPGSSDCEIVSVTLPPAQ